MPVASATIRPNDAACTPAAQSTVRAGMRSSRPSSCATITPCSSMPVTFVPVETVTPSRSSCFAAERDSFSGYVGRTTSSASINRIRESGGWILRKSLRSVSLAISPSAPASSTPVGPPPTTTNVIHSCRTSGSASRSAASNAIRIRRRISNASSMVLRPGANGAHSSWPKYAWRAPVATISVS